MSLTLTLILAQAAEAALREAVAVEDGLGYFEPPRWYQPSRHCLGWLLLNATADAAAAEQVHIPAHGAAPPQPLPPLRASGRRSLGPALGGSHGARRSPACLPCPAATAGPACAPSKERAHGGRTGGAACMHALAQRRRPRPAQACESRPARHAGAGPGEQVFREDLAEHPATGYALHGLAAALAAQGRASEAAAARAELAAAWRWADAPLASACPAFSEAA